MREGRQMSSSVQQDDEDFPRLTIEALEEFSEFALRYCDRESQVNMVIEEAGELLAAINKNRRGRCSIDDVVTECADVIVMIFQLRHMLSPEIVDEEVYRKMRRFKSRLG